jgi:hypothetical protein
LESKRSNCSKSANASTYWLASAADGPKRRNYIWLFSVTVQVIPAATGRCLRTHHPFGLERERRGYRECQEVSPGCGREDRRGHLIEQRLKYVVVAAIDQYDFRIGVPQRVRRCDPSKASADDNNALALSAWRLDEDSCRNRPALGQHGACSVSFMGSAAPFYPLIRAQ